MSIPQFNYSANHAYRKAKAIDLNLPDDAIKVAANMASVMSGETYIIELDDDGKFIKTVSLDAYDGIEERVSAIHNAIDLGWPIKVENLEDYNAEVRSVCDQLAEKCNVDRVNAHMFLGTAGRGSFGWHSDEGEVFCYMVSGTKLMSTGDEAAPTVHNLVEGDWLHMPEGVRHSAHNIDDNVMISFGTGSQCEPKKEITNWQVMGSLI